jgi:hypothetical protein
VIFFRLQPYRIFTRARDAFFALFAASCALPSAFFGDDTPKLAEIEADLERRQRSQSMERLIREQPQTPESPREAVMAYLVYLKAGRLDLLEGTFEHLALWSEEIGLDNLGELSFPLLSLGNVDVSRRYFESVPQLSDLAVVTFLSQWQRTAPLPEIDRWLETQSKKDAFWLETRFAFAAANHYLETVVPAYKASIEKDPSNVQAIKAFASTFHQDKEDPVSLDWLLELMPPKASDCYLIGWLLTGSAPNIAVAFMERALELPLTGAEIEERREMEARLSVRPMFGDPEKDFRWEVRSYLVQALEYARRSGEAEALRAQLDAEGPSQRFSAGTRET